jgi:hypothetical protein
MGLTFRLGQVPLAVFTDSSNNVGIGASANASFKLQVTGATNLTGALTASTATFESSGSGNTFLINHTSGSGIALTITKGGNGEGLIINKTSGTGNALSVTGTTSLGGALSGTSASFSSTLGVTGAATFSSSVTATGQLRTNAPGQSILINPGGTASVRMQLQNGTGNAGVAVESSTGGDQFSGTSAYSMAIGTYTERDLFLGTNSVQRFKLDASSGAATFSSSVTATSALFNTTTRYSNEIVGIMITNSGSVSAVPAALRVSNNGSGYIPKIILTDNNIVDAYITMKGGGTSATNYLSFGLGSNYNILNVLENGNVGIGTSSPSERLHLVNSTNGFVGLRLEGTSTYAGSDWTIYASSLSPSSADDFLGFFNNSTTDGATADYKLRIFKNGNVVIGGTTAQNSFLDRGNLTINGTESILNLSTSNTNAGYLFHNATNMFLVNAKNGATVFSTNGNQKMTVSSGYSVSYRSNNASNATFDLDYEFSSPISARIRFATTSEFNLNEPGQIGFWTRKSDSEGGGSVTERMRVGSYGFTASIISASDASSKTFMNSISSDCGIIPIPAGTTLYCYSRSGGTNYRALISTSTYFTGQHGNNPINMDLKTNIEEYVGLIVSSVGTYYSVNPVTQEVTTGKDAITISQALPQIKLTDTDKDKTVWGVVTNVNNDNFNPDGTIEYDNAATFGDRLGPNVIRVNSLGEGAIWVTNINGNIENGDYICSSLINGYGRKQDDDMLHNYSVAKSTMDCDFDLNNNNLYKCEEFEYDGKTYKRAFIGCTYHCA